MGPHIALVTAHKSDLMKWEGCLNWGLDPLGAYYDFSPLTSESPKNGGCAKDSQNIYKIFV